MTELSEIFSLLFCGFIAGWWFGTKMERNSWVVRAGGPTAHCVDGKFYYIREENPFTHTTGVSNDKPTIR